MASRGTVVDVDVDVAGGQGGTKRVLRGEITRIRIIPPAAGDYKLRVEDDIDGMFSMPVDGSALNGVEVMACSEIVAGPVQFLITDTALVGAFKLRVWGHFGVIA